MAEGKEPANRHTSVSSAGMRSFHVASAVNPKMHYVIDRSAWHEWLATELVDQCKYLLLHGHRQSGKSSAANAVDGILSPMSGVVSIPLIFGTMKMGSLEEFWTNFNGEMRASLVGKRDWYHQHSDQQTADLLDQLAKRDIVDNQTFRRFFDTCHWAGNRVVLLIDEFDRLLSACDEIRFEFLGALRDMKSANDAGEAKPCALVGMLAIGVYHILKLGTADAIPRRVSPFNVSEAVEPPRPTADQARTIFEQFQSDHGAHIHQEVVEDAIAMSGGHVGILSLLGREVATLAAVTKPLDIQSWCNHKGTGKVYGVLAQSATVQAMMYSLTAKENPEAMFLLTLLVLAPSGCSLERDRYPVGIDWLVTEGFIVPSAPGSSIYYFAADVFRSMLFRKLAFRRPTSMPQTEFTRDANRRVNLVYAVRETLPYFSFDNLTHELVLKKSGNPCEYAYQFALFSALLSKAGTSGWRVLCETRANEVPGNPPRLDITIASNGERYGIELLADGDKFQDHVDRAAVYAAQQNLRQVLVVNFTVTPEIFRFDPLPETVRVMQIYFNVQEKMMRVMSVDAEECPDEHDIPLHCHDDRVQQLTEDIASVSLRGTSVTSPPPVFALVLERAFRGADQAAVLIPQMEYEWRQNGPELARITKVGHLVNAVKAEFGGNMDFGKRYEPNVKVFAEDPRIGGQVNDKANTAKPLHNEIDGKEMDTIDNVGRGHDSEEHPYFVLVTRREDAPPVGTE